MPNKTNLMWVFGLVCLGFFFAGGEGEISYILSWKFTLS